MSTKEELLALFESAPGTWFSGEKLAASLSVSRAAVWKAVRSLRGEGYPIDAVTNRGYCLSGETDILSELGIWKYLSPDCRDLDLHVVPETGSTNAVLREKAAAGSPEGMVLIAGMQTEGRGRLGRVFFSPANTGLYMSILLRPERYTPEEAVRLTTMAAAAACGAIGEISGKDARIKWVNDIYLGGRKVCGILTEGSVSMETGRMDSVVLGIGINVYPPEGGFPEAIRDTAGAVYAEKQQDGKNRLAAGFLNRFMAYYREGPQADYVREYRQRSLVTGKRVTVLSPKGSRPACALDVDDACRLGVRYDDGTVEYLSAGEVRIEEMPDQHRGSL